MNNNDSLDQMLGSAVKTTAHVARNAVYGGILIGGVIWLANAINIARGAKRNEYGECSVTDVIIGYVGVAVVIAGFASLIGLCTWLNDLGNIGFQIAQVLLGALLIVLMIVGVIYIIKYDPKNGL